MNNENTKNDSFEELLQEFQQYKTNGVELGYDQSKGIEPEANNEEIPTEETLDPEIKVESDTIEAEDNTTSQGSVESSAENNNKFIDELIENPERIKELYTSFVDNQEELSKYKEQNVEEKLRAVSDISLEDIALVKAIKNGNTDAALKVLTDANIDPVDLVGNDDPVDIDLSEILEEQKVQEPVLSKDSILRKMSVQATVDGEDAKKVERVLGSFDEQSLIDISSDPDNIRKVLSSIDEVEKAINIYQEDLKYDFSGKLGKYDSFDQLKYGLEKIQSTIPKQEKVDDVVSESIEDTTKAIIEQQKQFPSGSTKVNTQKSDDGFEALLKEYRDFVG